MLAIHRERHIDVHLLRAEIRSNYSDSDTDATRAPMLNMPGCKAFEMAAASVNKS